MPTYPQDFQSRRADKLLCRSVRRKLTVGACAAFLAATPLLAGSVDGTWDMSVRQCARQISDGRIRISGNEIHFWESHCELTNPTAIRGMDSAMLYDAHCSGEGMTWSHRMLLAPTSDGGLLMFAGGYSSVYTRC